MYLMSNNTATAIKINPEIVCDKVDYTAEPMMNTVKKLERTMIEWKVFDNIEFTDQVGTFKDRPVYKIEADSLDELVRKCNAKRGRLIEPHDQKEMESLQTLMKESAIKKIVL